ncbi:hypothetical protein AXF42_Ash020594 [Apostasia shenzhenica]|uniref:Uncharacterized protein n=1 Tax=Apostasia shenzhenica TaxID=1088818 RepID=A0A2I0A0D5_9ASPA|nr:hypothetical protein AXF42_Ash020594 [Apostasia shenzhenica]
MAKKVFAMRMIILSWVLLVMLVVVAEATVRCAVELPEAAAEATTAAKPVVKVVVDPCQNPPGAGVQALTPSSAASMEKLKMAEHPLITLIASLLPIIFAFFVN